MSAVLSAFCKALGLPDPHAVLVERARVDVEAFRLVARQKLVNARWYDWIQDMSPRSLAEVAGPLAEKISKIAPDWAIWNSHVTALAHVRAISEALGHPLPPSPEEERAVAYRLAQLAVDTAADLAGSAGYAEEVWALPVVTDRDSAGVARTLLNEIWPLVDDRHPVRCAARALACVCAAEANRCSDLRGRIVAQEIHEAFVFAADHAAQAIASAEAGPGAMAKARALVAELSGVIA